MSDLPTKTYPPEFLEAMIADHEAEQAGATPEESSAVQAKGDAMSEIDRFTWHDSGLMLRSKDGAWVRYEDHRAEMERLNADLRDRNRVRIELNSAQIEATHLRTELAEAHDRCRALELAAEQADEMKAHAEASVAAEEAETDRVTAERDAAQAEVERLTQEVEERRATNQRVMAERDAARDEVARLRTTLAWADATIYRLQAERDQTETRPKGREVGAGSPSDQSAQNLDMVVANCKETLASSRPTDEDIWREAFMMAMQRGGVFDRMTVADLALAEYRKRWPR